MKFLKSFFAAAAILIAAASCTKEAPKVNFDGSYDGNLVLTVGDPEAPFQSTVTVKNSLTGQATIITKEFAAMGGRMQMPSLEIKNVEITNSKGVSTLKAKPFTIEVGEKAYVSAKGLTGTFQDGTLKVMFDIKPGMMPGAIDFAFEGSIR